MTNFFKQLDEEINKHENIIIMGHKNPDLDCIASSLGLYKTIEKECYIFKTTDELNASSTKAYQLLKDINFINKTNYKEKLKNTLLIITDLHKKQLLEYEKILEEIKDIIIIDHHIEGKDKIPSTLEYIDSLKSSATEIITEYIRYKNKKIDEITATIMLAGIEIDTNGYNMKTTKSTFEASAWLMEMNANNIIKQNILKENKQEYIKRTKQIEQSYNIGNITICLLDNNTYNPSYLATLSEDLLRFENIEASFTIGYIAPNKIGISARSLGNINVEQHMTNLGGGGHLTDAACQFENKTLKEVEQILKQELNKKETNMIKNIVLDVGGILFDDSKSNTEKILNKNCDIIYKTAYGPGFKECLLGHQNVQDHIQALREDKNYKDLKYILEKDNLKISYPLIKENYEYIKTLKEKGYKLYLLTNITKDSYEYIDEVINIKSLFDGGIYSYQEKVVKPNQKIYELLIERFNLNKKETIFFDDKEKNVIASNQAGIKSIQFKSIEDIKNNINN